MKLTLKLTFLTLLFALTITFITAQKPKQKAKPTSRAKPRATPKPTPKTEDFEDLFNFVFEDPPASNETGKNVSDGDRKKAEEFFKKGQAFWKELEIDDAIDSHTKALEIYPNYADAVRERGKIYFMIGRYKEAAPDLTAFLKLQPVNTEIMYYRALTYSALAEEILDAETERQPAEGYAEKSLNDFNKVLELEPKNSMFLNGRGRLYLNFQLYKEAIADLEKAISLDNKYSVAYNNLGLAKFYSGADLGLTEFDKSIEIYNGYAETYFNRANVYRSIGSYDKAITDFNQAIKLHGTRAAYYNARGMAYFAKGDGIAAVKDFSNAIGQKRDYARAYYNRAYTYKKFPASASDEETPTAGGSIVAQIDKMKQDLDSAIRYNPIFADAYIERGKYVMGWLGIPINGYSAEDLVKIRAALADFDKAVKLSPNSAEAFEGRASCNDSLGKKDLALADYNKAIELDPDLATAYMGRMGIYCEMGEKELSIIDEKKIKALGYAAINVCSLKGR